MGVKSRLSVSETVIAVMACLTAVLAALDVPAAPQDVSRAGIETIIVLVVLAIAAALAAGALASKAKPNSPVQNKNNPTSLANEGDFSPLIIGRRQVGPMYCSAGARFIKKRDIDVEGKFGGGGGSGGQEIIYFEDAWHGICVGPTKKLWAIRRNGKILFRGPITEESHPSGTSIDFGNPGSFRIFWGEVDQPTSIQASLTSRWPNMCFVKWRARRLGRNPVWGQYTYEVEVRPQLALLTNTPAWMEGTKTLASSALINNINSATDGAAGLGFLEIVGDFRKRYRPGTQFQVTGNSLGPAGTELTVLSLSYSKITLRTTITCVEAISGSDSNGTIRKYQDIVDDGVNGAHALAQLLFAPWPHGRGLDQSLFDIPSLETLGTLMVTENTPLSILIRDGEKLETAIADILTDLGVMIPLNPSTGLYTFVSIRRPWGDIFDVTTVPAEMMLPPLPEIKNMLAPKSADRVIFQFADRLKKYRQRTLLHDDDGAMTQSGVQNSIETELQTVISHGSAVVIANRRSQEAEADGAEFRINVNHEGRAFYPGLAFLFNGLPGVLRVIQVKPTALSAKTQLRCVTDFYGATTNTHLLPVIATTLDDDEDVFIDPGWGFIEVPKYLSPGVNSIFVLRIRENDSTEYAELWISRDDLTYVKLGTQLSVHAGGLLNDAITATESFLSSDGPEVTVLGPDIADVQDLSADATNWRLGRQIAIIGQEIFFLDGVTVIDADNVRLGKMLRGRYASAQSSHDVGDTVFILDFQSVEAWRDVLLVAGQPLYLKVQPYTGETVPLDEIDAKTRTLVGRGVVPLPCKNLRTVNMSNTFLTGDNIGLAWAYLAGVDFATGAGNQGAGTAVNQTLLDGEFVLRFLTTGDVLKATVTPTVSENPAYTITNANLVSWFGSEPSNFKVEVTVLFNGHSSEALTITINRV